MNKFLMLLLLSGVFLSADVIGQEWKDECIGYYKMQLPDDLEVALYPVGLILEPRTNPGWTKTDFVNHYLFPKISFSNERYQDNKNIVQSQFSGFYYNGYEISVSTENNNPIDMVSYKNGFKNRADIRIQDYWTVRDYEISLKLSVLPKDVAEQSLAYKIDDYPNAFLASDSGGYSLHITKKNRIYIFNKSSEEDTLSKQLNKNNPEVLSLLSRFRSRQLYEMPSEQGFCLPYGFIANDSGHEPRNMGVTYRLKDHPDVTIFFQDLGMNKELSTDKENMKDAVTHMWNSHYLMGASKKELLSPKWKSIEMDGRTGMGTYVKATYNNVPVYDKKEHVVGGRNYIDYGYLAYVRGDKSDRSKEPDLLLYVSQDSSQAKNAAPMDKDELFDIAERITRSVKRR